MTVDPALAQDFLQHQRIAVVGASEDPKKFGSVIFRELVDRGYDAVPVNPTSETVASTPCFPNVSAVPGPSLDGVIVMVPGDRAVDVVRDCIDAHVPRVWLFKGIGSPGAVTDEAVALCEEHGVDVIAGACPLMFLEPVGGAHRFHRFVRRLNGSLAKSA